MQKREGCKYRSCAICGKEWNVSIQNKDKPYRCPVCRKRGRENERK